VSLDWIVFAAMFMEVCGADDSCEFSEFVGSNGTKLAITPLLEEVGRSGGKLVSEWGRKVLASLARQ